jgi:glutamine amidotransferase PdxT
LPNDKDDGIIVAAKQGHFLATSFHPELTGDDRFHRSGCASIPDSCLLAVHLHLGTRP